MGEPEGDARYHIRAVDRALTILKVFLTRGPELTAGEISAELCLHPTTTFRMLATLEAHGFVKHDPATRRYRLGAICLELGSLFLKASHLRDAALAVMQRLRDHYGETVHLAMLDGDHIVWLEKMPGLHPVGLMASRVGERAMAHSTATGKVLLAHLPPPRLDEFFAGRTLTARTAHTIVDRDVLRAELAQVRARGYATDNQENEVGVKCIAVPIFDHKGIRAGMSVSAPAERMDLHLKAGGLLEDLRQAAVEISTEIGWGRGVDQIEVPTRHAA